MLFEDQDMPTAWKNTLYYSFLGVIFGYLVPLLIALFINEVRRGKSFFRLVFYTPTVVPPMAAMLLWKWIYDPRSGLANLVVGLFGGEPLLWLNSPDTAMLSIVFMSTWAYSGGTMLLYLAALQGVPASLYEAAEIDGANPWQQFLHITIPLLRQAITLTVVLGIINNLKAFALVFVMTQGGPAGTTELMATYVYQQAFGTGQYRFGFSAAASMVLFVLIMIFTLFSNKLGRSEEVDL